MATTNIQTFAGNVGIGTNDPGSYKLNVSGTVKASSLTINGVTNSQVPIGLIALWYGTVASIPTGWVLCDGTTGIAKSDGSGTIDAPDLTDKFVLGAAGDSPTQPYPTQSGGAHTKTINTANLPSHTHPISLGQGGSHTHPFGSAGLHDHPIASNGSHTHNASTGGGGAHAHYLLNGQGQSIGFRGYLNNTPNFRGMVVDAFVYGVNWNGFHGLYNNTNFVGNHGHSVSIASNGEHIHTLGQGGSHTHPFGSAGLHDHPISIGNTGSGTALNVQPAYYVLAYIMKI
jgi:microcystin-dependent protein